jgi:glycosyltransferase involved in cell wall biosynthesis
MRILVIHQYYLRPGEPGGTRFNEFCAMWRAAGHQVDVVASSVPYTTGVRDAAGGPWRTRSEDGIDVTRVWTVEQRSGERARRLASMSTFGALSVFAALSRHADVVIASSPSLVTAVSGALAAAHNDAPFIFEVRDLWPESAVTTGVMAAGSPLVRAAEGLEEWACECADGVVALTPGIRDDILRRRLAMSQCVHVIPNGVDVSAIPVVDRRALRRELGWDDFVAVYAGAHGLANDLDQLIDAARLLQGEPGIRIVAFGDGPRRRALVQRTERLGLTNIEWRAALAPERLREVLQAADAGLVVLQDNPTFRTVYPNKAFDYMAAALPVICGVDGVARELVISNGVGVFVEPAAPRRLADALVDLHARPSRAREMGEEGRRLVERSFDRREHAQQYLELMVGLVRSDTGRT